MTPWASVNGEVRCFLASLWGFSEIPRQLHNRRSWQWVVSSISAFLSALGTNAIGLSGCSTEHDGMTCDSNRTYLKYHLSREFGPKEIETQFIFDSLFRIWLDFFFDKNRKVCLAELFRMIIAYPLQLTAVATDTSTRINIALIVCFWMLRC